MLIPGIFYGSHADVRRAARRLLRDVSQDRLGSLPTMQSLQSAGDVFIDCTRGHPRGDHYFPYILMQLAVTPPRVPDDKLLAMFDALVALEPWGPLCLLGQAMKLIDVDAGRQDRLLHAVVRCWKDYLSVGQRFATTPLLGRSDIWSQNSYLKTILWRLGVSTDVLTSPLPGNDLAPLAHGSRMS